MVSLLSGLYSIYNNHKSPVFHYGEQYYEEMNENDVGDPGQESDSWDTPTWNVYRFEQKYFPEIHSTAESVNLTDSCFFITGAKITHGLATMKLSSLYNLENFKLLLRVDGQETCVELPLLRNMMNCIEFPCNERFQIIGFEGTEFTGLLDKTEKVKRTGQVTYKAKQSGTFIFMNKFLVVKSVRLEAGDTTSINTNVDNILEVK